MAPERPPMAAPIAIPANGTKNSMPMSMPQKAPPSARQIGCLLHLDFAILLAHNDAGIINLDELSLLQVNELIAYLFRTVLVIKGHDDEITHVFAPFLKSLLHLASISSIVSR